MTDMGDDVDIRTDVPLCRVFRDGAMIAQSHDVSEYWCKALVSFVIDCSFAFEHARVDAGIGIRHIEPLNVECPRLRSRMNGAIARLPRTRAANALCVAEL
ncbi:hypothetical protein [Paraburkholderia tropica]|uniref:hypothetical protein n=1 Tax=Paraburkholderia tropica TaxID=92647 RepID=UPI0012E9A6C2|nr:hypothetical protein [Paraburkholderia tropica]MBB2980616.1 uncharacterized protein YcsI (UPF0317 family) [Paraburkholderia tropica]